MAAPVSPVKAPVAPVTNGVKAPVASAPVASAPVASAPVVETTGADAKKDKRPKQQIIWPTAAAAAAEAEKRTYGPRKAYTVKVGTTTVHCVAYNSEYAAYEAFITAGGTIEELGGTTRARKPITTDAVLQAAQSMSPEALRALKEALAKL